MTDVNVQNCSENVILVGKQNDVVSMQQSTSETNVMPSDDITGNKAKLVDDSNLCGATGTLLANEFKEQSASTSVENDCNLMNNAKPRGKRRRRKSNRSKQKTHIKPYKKSNWKFQLPRIRYGAGDEGGVTALSGLVPYNTNKFLMEEHMPEVILGRVSPSGRTRNSSFSVDSEDYFNALPEDEEAFLTKEFSSVYETARTERLDGMSKTQLIKEYLQLEANYDKLSKTLGARVSFDVDAKAKERNVICRLEERIKQLSDENLELRRRMADIRNRGKRSHSHGSHYTISSTSSEDSESDSSSTSSTTSRSRSSGSSSDVEVVEELNCNSVNNKH